MNLYKITFGTKKKIYESKETFEHNWHRHMLHYADCYELIAYKFEQGNWKEIRRSK